MLHSQPMPSPSRECDSPAGSATVRRERLQYCRSPSTLNGHVALARHEQRGWRWSICWGALPAVLQCGARSIEKLLRVTQLVTIHLGSGAQGSGAASPLRAVSGSFSVKLRRKLASISFSSSDGSAASTHCKSPRSAKSLTSLPSGGDHVVSTPATAASGNSRRSSDDTEAVSSTRVRRLQSQELLKNPTPAEQLSHSCRLVSPIDEQAAEPIPAYLPAGHLSRLGSKCDSTLAGSKDGKCTSSFCHGSERQGHGSPWSDCSGSNRDICAPSDRAVNVSTDHQQ